MRQVAGLLRAEFIQITDPAQLSAKKVTSGQVSVFWNLDDTRDHSMATAVRALASPNQVIGIGKDPLETVRLRSGSPLIPDFGQLLFRQFSNPAAMVIARLIEAASSRTSGANFSFAQEGSEIENMELTGSFDRRLIVEQVHHYLVEKKVPERLAGTASQAMDELVMNAVFNAPVKDGVAYRRGTERSADYALTEKEKILFEIAVGADYTTVLVRDQFGSLRRDKALSYLSQSFESRGYSPDERVPGAGLGIFGVSQSGVSLIYLTRRDISTDAILIFKTAKRFSEFKDSFRFIGFIEK